MIQIILLVVLIIAISILLLSIKIIVKKRGEFASIHIHDSEHMRKRGIGCVLDEDKKSRKDNPHAISE